MTSFHLAQVNIALPLEPVESERLAGFMALLEPINAIADTAPGFVWRLQTEDGDATAVRAFADERLLMNMSVWDSVESFGAFVYGPAHVAVMKQRRQWFVPMREAYTALWWIPAGTVPTPQDAVVKIDELRAHGPSAEVFTLTRPFPPPDDDLAPVVPEDWTCSV